MEKELKRCAWVNKKPPIYVEYHDTEWGVPVYDDKKLFEMLILESFQAGLSWLTILNKREAFRESFDNFDVQKVANYGEEKIAQLLENPKIVRSRGKIVAAINNAKIFIEIQKEFGSFSKYIWAFSGNKVIKNKDNSFPASTPLSDAVSEDLKRRGMRYTGTVIVYSYLQAIGVVDDHARECFRY